MSARWPMVRLGEVLAHSEEPATPHLERTYSETTVRMKGKGVVERRRVSGAAVSGGGN